MSIIDIILLVIIVVSAIWGIFKGFVSQIVNIFAILIGVWCGFKFSGYVATTVKEYFSLSISGSTLHIAMFIIILIAVIILGALIGKAMDGLIKLSMLGWLNRILGFIFAGLKTVLILCLIIYVINYLNNLWDFIPQQELSKSKGYFILTDISSKIFPYLSNIKL